MREAATDLERNAWGLCQRRSILLQDSTGSTEGYAANQDTESYETSLRSRVGQYAIDGCVIETRFAASCQAGDCSRACGPEATVHRRVGKPLCSIAMRSTSGRAARASRFSSCPTWGLCGDRIAAGSPTRSIAPAGKAGRRGAPNDAVHRAAGAMAPSCSNRFETTVSRVRALVSCSASGAIAARLPSGCSA